MSYFARILLLCCFILSGCHSTQEKLHIKLSKDDPNNLEYKGHYKVGDKYTIKGCTYSPTVDIKYKETGIASWYGTHKAFHNKKTANGDRYDKNLLSAAHRHMPMPSLVKVTNIKNNKTLVVLVNDRGPFTKNRIIDVSEKAAEILGFKQAGVTTVKVEYLHKETQEFLRNFGLLNKTKKQGKTKKLYANNKYSKCSINCHVKLINKAHRTNGE